MFSICLKGTAMLLGALQHPGRIAFSKLQRTTPLFSASCRHAGGGAFVNTSKFAKALNIDDSGAAMEEARRVADERQLEAETKFTEANTRKQSALQVKQERGEEDEQRVLRCSHRFQRPLHRPCRPRIQATSGPRARRERGWRPHGLSSPRTRWRRPPADWRHSHCRRARRGRGRRPHGLSPPRS